MKTKDKNMITEELLAAFEEGKTNAEETALVLEYLATDESLQEEFILSQQLDAMMGADDEETDFLPMAQMAAKSEGNLCDFQCEQFILKRRKIEYNSDELSEATGRLPARHSRKRRTQAAYSVRAKRHRGSDLYPLYPAPRPLTGTDTGRRHRLRLQKHRPQCAQPVVCPARRV